jgi:hypothetical protein
MSRRLRCDHASTVWLFVEAIDAHWLPPWNTEYCDMRCARRSWWASITSSPDGDQRQLVVVLDLRTRRDGILTVRQQRMKLAGLPQGGRGISVSVGNGSSDSDEDIAVRIKAGVSPERAHAGAAAALTIARPRVNK